LGWKFTSTPNYWADKALFYKEQKFSNKADQCFLKAINGNNINTIVQYGIFLKEEKRLAEALKVFGKGKMVLNEQKPPLNNKDWWENFVENEINNIKNELP